MTVCFSQSKYNYFVVVIVHTMQRDYKQQLPFVVCKKTQLPAIAWQLLATSWQLLATTPCVLAIAGNCSAIVPCVLAIAWRLNGAC